MEGFLDCLAASMLWRTHAERLSSVRFACQGLILSSAALVLTHLNMAWTPPQGAPETWDTATVPKGQAVSHSSQVTIHVPVAVLVQ